MLTQADPTQADPTQPDPTPGRAVRDPAARWARACWAASEPFTTHPLLCHEHRARYKALGLRGVEGFLVARGAVLGTAHPAVVQAAFHGFPAAAVSATFPAAWERLSPAEAIEISHTVLGGVFARLFADHPVAPRVAPLAERLAEVVGSLVTAGRPLAAGNQAVAAAPEPWARLWRALTTLREFRGDGHVAVLTAAGLDVTEAHVLMVGWDGSPVDEDVMRRARAIDDTDWTTARARLLTRGLGNADGSLTAAGAALRQRIEEQTDEVAAAPFRDLGLAGVRELRDVTSQLSEVVLAQGWAPQLSSVGAPWPAPPIAV